MSSQVGRLVGGRVGLRALGGIRSGPASRQACRITGNQMCRVHSKARAAVNPLFLQS
jgi:hypothetical protein